jgi:hypothetical protein
VHFLPQPSRCLLASCRRRFRLGNASRAESTLGEEAPTCTTTTEANLRARAPLDIAPATVEEWSSCTIVASPPWTDSIVVSLQNEFPMSPRSCQKSRIKVWSTVGRIRNPPRCRPWRLPMLCSCQCRLKRKEAP